MAVIYDDKGIGVSTTPVSKTSKSNAETIAKRYEDRGLNATVVSTGSGTYGVRLSGGSSSPPSSSSGGSSSSSSSRRSSGGGARSSSSSSSGGSSGGSSAPPSGMTPEEAIEIGKKTGLLPPWFGIIGGNAAEAGGTAGGGSSGSGGGSSGSGGRRSSSTGGSGSSGTTVARPADIPVRDTSQDNAETIAQRYRDRGYSAEVINQGGGKYAVQLGTGSLGVSPISTSVNIEKYPEPSGSGSTGGSGITPGKTYYNKRNDELVTDIWKTANIGGDTYTIVKLNQRTATGDPYYGVFKNGEPTNRGMHTDPEDYLQVLYLNYGTKEQQEAASDILNEIRTQIPTGALPNYDPNKSGARTYYPVEIIGNVTADDETYQILKMEDDRTDTKDKDLYGIYKNGKLLFGNSRFYDPETAALHVWQKYGTTGQKKEANSIIFSNSNSSGIKISEDIIAEANKNNPYYINQEIFKNAPDIPGANTYINDRTGMTATPAELPWTTSGKIKANEKTGQGGLTPDQLGIPDAETMRLNKLHYVGVGEGGRKQYVNESPYQIKFDYTPYDPDYTNIKSNIESNLNIIDRSIGNINTNISNAETSLVDLNQNLNTIKSSNSNTVWTYDLDPSKLETEAPDTYNWIKENMGFKETYTKDEAQKLTNYFIGLNQDVLKQKDMLPELQKQREQLEDTLFTVNKYEDLGYKVDVKDDKYKFSLPKASEVHSSIFGEHEATAMSSAAFMESPLAIKTVGSAIWEWATGDKKVGKTRREELAQYSLGLYENIHKGDYGGYLGDVATSPAMVQGVYIPLATMGAGYALTGLTAGGSTGASIASSTLSKVGATTAGHAFTTGAKTVMIGAGAYGIANTAGGLIQTYQERPEALPGMVAETAFTFGMAYGGYKTGQSMWKQRHTGSWKWNWNKNKAEWSPEELRRQDVKGVSDVLEYRLDNKSAFTVEGGQKVGGTNVKIRLHGIGEQLPDKDVFTSRGSGYMEWTEKGSWGSKITHTKFFDFKGAGKQVDVNFLPKDYAAYGQKSVSMLRSGGGSTGQGASIVKDWGVLKITDKGLTATEIPYDTPMGYRYNFPLPKKFTSLYKGTYETTEGIFGNQYQVGRTISFNLNTLRGSGGSGSSAGGVTGGGGGVVGSGGGGSVLNIDYSTILSSVGEKAAAVVKTTPATGATTTSFMPVAASGLSPLGSNVASADGLVMYTGSQEYDTGVQNADLGITQKDYIPTGVGTQLNLIGIQKTTGTGKGSGRRSGSGRSISVGAGLGVDLENKGAQIVSAPQQPILMPEVKPDTTTGLITGELMGESLIGGEILEPGGETKWDYDVTGEVTPGLFMGELNEQEKFEGTRTDQGQAQVQQQQQQQQQKQAQKLGLRQSQKLNLISETITVTPTISVNPTIPPPVPVPLKFPDQKEQLIKRKTRKKAKTRPPKIAKGEADKGLLSDLLSVTRSQAKFGVATHPKLTKKTWKEGAKTLYMKVPTKELKREKKKKKKKPNLLGRNKNVFM